MIFIALGANLPTAQHGSPVHGLAAAVRSLADAGVRTTARSRWYRTAPVPPATAPWFVNGVIRVETTLPPIPLVLRLQAIESAFGRRRGKPGAGRPLDLDLLDYGGSLLQEPARDGKPAVTLPHPRLHARAFVLLPLRDIAPDWRHPASGATLDSLICALPPGQVAEPLADARVRTRSPVP